MDPRECKSYSEIVKHLGQSVPCYARNSSGCHVNDDSNEEFCGGEEGCLLLRVYTSGYEAGLAARPTIIEIK